MSIIVPTHSQRPQRRPPRRRGAAAGAGPAARPRPGPAAPAPAPGTPGSGIVYQRIQLNKGGRGGISRILPAAAAEAFPKAVPGSAPAARDFKLDSQAQAASDEPEAGGGDDRPHAGPPASGPEVIDTRANSTEGAGVLLLRRRPGGSGRGESQECASRQFSFLEIWE
jgi:hypothetical protein